MAKPPKFPGYVAGCTSQLEDRGTSRKHAINYTGNLSGTDAQIHVHRAAVGGYVARAAAPLAHAFPCSVTHMFGSSRISAGLVEPAIGRGRATSRSGAAPVARPTGPDIYW